MTEEENPSEDSLKFWLQHIESFHPADIKLGLDRIKLVAEQIGLFTNAGLFASTGSESREAGGEFNGTSSAAQAAEKQPKIIIVGGTNGKGSCVAMLESLCLTNNYSVGCYTSPHLLDFNERIRINGQMVTDDVLVEAFKSIEQKRQQVALTFFEFTTLAALVVFRQFPLDLIVLEVGLGGRQDATNFVEPDLSVITTIDIDHTDWLSNDIDRIAYEKAGIMRMDKTTLVGDQKSYALLNKVVPEFCHQAHVVENAHHELAKKLTSEQDNPYQLLPQNLLLAKTAFESVLGVELNDQNFFNALRSIKINGRFQQVDVGTNDVMNNNIGPVIVDVAHNAQAAGNLAKQLERFVQSNNISRVTAICGMMADKAVSDVLETLSSQINHWCFVDLDMPRAMESSQLLTLHRELQLKSSAAIFISVKEAFDSIVKSSLDSEVNSGQTMNKADELVLVFGSFITVANMLRYAQKK
ncbi:bifunctional folylpolyglutamate synthase/dihydrofolate synthase [Aliikangiella coralliicola]|uniref:Dihydrofolate synthase/folylpolyglutamate synthase n=1 Tax=Aliikangiella coralliicola TaxID=2592383 RepID=A0A545UCZ6_9GAMM|nr:folylpolyglutamate synthase/dihydrofolate synthase family protein [Aliikangiella coralliicola]TQV87335.1 bifunctional folylpolyglutamate synthase/dihydrofolate synthase [Aliikangiella coralliicola]